MTETPSTPGQPVGQRSRPSFQEAATAAGPGAASAPRTPQPVAAPRGIAGRLYQWALLAFLLAGCAQIFLAGLGVFSFGDHDAAGGASAFDAHKALGFTLAGVAIVIFLLALAARAGAPSLVLCGVLIVQTSLLQSLLAGLADSTALFGGLHAVDGLLVLGIAGFLYGRARRHW